MPKPEQRCRREEPSVVGEPLVQDARGAVVKKFVGQGGRRGVFGDKRRV